jgi:hypothetical protein
MKNQKIDECTNIGLFIMLLLFLFLLFLGGAEPTEFNEDGYDEYNYTMDTYVIPISRWVLYTIGTIGVLLIIINVYKKIRK